MKSAHYKKQIKKRQTISTGVDLPKAQTEQGEYLPGQIAMSLL